MQSIDHIYIPGSDVEPEPWPPHSPWSGLINNIAKLDLGRDTGEHASDPIAVAGSVAPEPWPPENPWPAHDHLEIDPEVLRVASEKAVLRLIRDAA